MRLPFITLVCVALLIIASGTDATAEDENAFGIYLTGGIGLLAAPDSVKNEHGPGMEVGFGLGYRFKPRFEALFRFDFFNLPLEEDVTEGSLSGGQFRPLFIGLNGKYFLLVRDDDLEIFAMGGLGLVNVSFNDRREGTRILPTPETEWEFYFNIGGGLQFPFSERLAGFVTGRYIWFNLDPDAGALIPFAIGIRLGF